MPTIDDPSGDKCRNRVVEWLTTLMLINFGLTTVLSPDTLIAGSFRYMTALHITPGMFAFACIAAGLARFFALYFNGYGLPWSARVRALTAVFGALVFSIMGLSLVFLTKDTGTLSLGAGTHFLLAAAELYSCLRAGSDVNEQYRRDRSVVSTYSDTTGYDDEHGDPGTDGPS
jgi:hypothetical protein